MNLNKQVPTGSSSKSYLPVKWGNRGSRKTINTSYEPKVNLRSVASNKARLNAKIKPKCFNATLMQERLTRYLDECHESCQYNDLSQLLEATRIEKLLAGDLILEMVDLPLHRLSAKNQFHDWVSQSFFSFLSKEHTSKEAHFYIHVAVYVGSYGGKDYVVDAGGRDSFIPMLFGRIGLRTLQNAFNPKSRFFIVPPFNDNPSIVLQRGLGAIGTKYLYHNPVLTSEMFLNVLLGGVSEDTFTQSWNPLSLLSKQSVTMNRDVDNAKYFHNELTSQIRMIRSGIHLTLGSYFHRKNKREKPWFRQVIRAFVDLMTCIRSNDAEKCFAIINTTGVPLSSYDKNGDTPLTFAAKQGLTNICMHLVDFTLGWQHLKMALGADINLPNENGNSGLMEAFSNCHYETCSTLIALGADAHDAKFQNLLCDSSLKLYLKGEFQECTDLLYHFKDIVGIEIFYNYFLAQATHERTQKDYLKIMDNIHPDHLNHKNLYIS